MLETYDPSRNAVRTLRELVAWHGEDRELVLEPERPILDTHHHLWRRPNADYLVGEISADIAGSGHNIVATVFMEGGASYRADVSEDLRPVSETELAVDAVQSADAAGPTKLCAAIVGRADLTLGDRVKPVLEAHIEAAPGRFRGIRHPLRWDAAGIGMFGKPGPRALALNPAFRAGFAHLAPLGLSFDAWMFHHQLDELADLAGAFPDTTIIVNHVGGPLGTGPYAGRRSEVFAHWRQGIAALARRPNVMMKLGGLGMLYFGFGFYKAPSPPRSTELARAWRPYIEECIAQFGVVRSMFESNFPVDKQSSSYRALWNAFKIITRDFSETEKSALYCSTGARAYRICI